MKFVCLYYDSYEKKFGDGFYAYTRGINGYASIMTGFKNVNGCWQQVTGDPITGFDGNEKIELLKLLNDEIFQSSVIRNRYGYVIY